jgi:hypothetical protein
MSERAWTVDQSTPRYRMNGARVVSAAQRAERMKFYHMNYAASGSDGTFYSEILIAVDASYCIAPEAWIRRAALVIGGEPMIFVMGVCPSEGWTLRSVEADRWATRATGRVSGVDGSRGPIEALFLSDGPPIDGWPEPARLEDLQTGAALAAKVENRAWTYGFKD